jgi:cytochrome c oxidase subunit I+III
MVIPTFARTRIVGYPLIAAATVAIGIVSFGLWVHHMFATGIPLLALSYFAAGSFVIAIPSGVQVFAWIATLWRGKVHWDTPLLWVVGAIVTFIAGGVTGVMVASVPFDWQAHDTYFVVAHFHYVLMGGVVFPIFAGLHYWTPKLTGGCPTSAGGRSGSGW